MKINAGSDPSLQRQNASSLNQEASDFAAALALIQQQHAAGIASKGIPSDTPQKQTLQSMDRMTALRKELSDWLEKDPIEHMRDAILEELGLSEESLSQLPPEQKAAVEDYIAEKIKERLLAANDIPKQQTASPLSVLEALQAQMQRADKAVGET